MINRPLAEITEQDLLSLVHHGIHEGRTLDYKVALPAQGDTSEFVADVTSFANTDGGDIVYGMNEIGGAASDLIGIQVANLDDERLRLENACRDLTEPRVNGMSLRFVALGNGRHALIVRVARSWNGPHRNNKNRNFFARNSAGKYPLDVNELRQHFLASASLSNRLAEFRGQRIQKINAGRTSVTLNEVDSAVLLIHVVPVGTFLAGETVSVDKKLGRLQQLRPPGLQGAAGGCRVNFDGAVVFAGTEARSRAYVQFFRSGPLEYAASFKKGENGERRIHAKTLENFVGASVLDALDLYKELEATGPYAVMVSLTRCQEYTLIASEESFGGPALTLPGITTPPILIESTDSAITTTTLVGTFEIVWNSFGLTRPLGFNPQ